MIKKDIDSFSGAVRYSKCTNCKMVANYDLEEVGHDCPMEDGPTTGQKEINL